LCGGYSYVGEQPERRYEAEDRAEPSGLCSLVSALSLAESEKLERRANSICAIRGILLDGFTVEMMTIGARGMIWGRGFGGLDLAIEGLGVCDFSLMGRLVVDGES